MRKYLLATVVLALCVSAGSVSEAISTGPSGRVYLAARYDDGVTLWVNIQSFTLDAAWAGGTVVDHGNVVDNSNGTGPYAGWANHANCGYSPEIETHAGTGYGTLVMGLYYNRYPVAVRNPADLVMDVVRITPTDGSHTEALLSDGRAGQTTSSTESGLFALPNPTENGQLNTQFTGSADAYVTSNAWRWRPYYSVNRDTYGDGDIADNAADYVAKGIDGIWAEVDMELYRARLYGTAHWGAIQNASHGVFYIENNAGVYSGKIFWSSGAYGQVPYPVPKTPETAGRSPVAVGKIKDANSVERDAAWTCSTLGTQIVLLADLNGDGDAMDNSQVTGLPFNEWRVIYDTLSTPGSPEDDPTGLEYNDIEVTKNADGTMFLLFINALNNLVIVELTDSGEFAGAGKGNPEDYTAYVTGLPTTQGGNKFPEIEFDSMLDVIAIPEPATTLLLGTGALAVIGILRRRRMR